MKFLLVALLATTAITTSPHLQSNAQSESNTYQMEVTRKLPAPHPCKQFLLICSGNMSTRKVVQDLQYELNKRLKKYNAATDIEYLGATQEFSMNTVAAAAAKHPHDVVLLFTPQDVNDSTIERLRVKTHPLKHGPLTSSFYTKLIASTHQTIFLTIFGDEELNTPFWSAGIEIWTELSNRSVYKDLADDLIRRWEVIQLIDKDS